MSNAYYIIWKTIQQGVYCIPTMKYKFHQIFSVLYYQIRIDRYVINSVLFS